MVDDELRAAVEQLRQGLASVRGLEGVLLLDRQPGELLALARELVAEPCVLLLALEEHSARGKPFFSCPDPVIGHRFISFFCGRRSAIASVPQRSAERRESDGGGSPGPHPWVAGGRWARSADVAGRSSRPDLRPTQNSPVGLAYFPLKNG